MLIKSRVMISGAVALLALAACTPKEADKSGTAAAANTAPSKDAIAATVNGSPISQKAVDSIIKERHMPDTPEMRKMIIENLAIQLIVAQEAVKKGLDKTPETLDQIEMAKQGVLDQAFVEDYFKTNAVTDAQLAAEYDKLKGNEYKARHILVKTEDEAKAIIAKLNKDPKSFEAIAKEKSSDPGSKDKGGELGWFDPHHMVPEFGDALKTLEKGKITETPVKTQYGYHVIQLEDVRPNTIPPLEQMKAGLTKQLQQQSLKKLIDDMKASAKIDIVAAAAPASAPAAAPAATPAAPAAPAAEATPAPAPAAAAPAPAPEKK